MENLKFNLLIVIVFVVLGGLVYWSVSSMDNGVYYTRDIDNAEPIIEDTEEPVVTEPVVQEPEETSSISAEKQELIAKIEKLKSDVVVMKNGSRGTRVGTVQTFLNLYNNTDKRVDNDYGPKTVAAVKAFQSDQGLSADGETGPNTYDKMIEWLQNN